MNPFLDAQKLSPVTMSCEAVVIEGRRREGERVGVDSKQEAFSAPRRRLGGIPHFLERNRDSSVNIHDSFT